MAGLDITALQQHFTEHGWIVIQLPDPQPVYQVRDALLQQLRRLTGNHQVTLETYHQLADDDQQHTQWHLAMAQFFRDQQWAREIIAAQHDFFRAFLGPDISFEHTPYLRIARPDKLQDNLGYHQDTSYGGSPFELSVVIPYVDLPAASSLSVLSGSHVRPVSDFPTTQVKAIGIERGSPVHKLGFPYSPKVLDPAYTVGMQPIPLKVGEALIFCFATVHGTVQNSGSVCRWTSDIRVANSLVIDTLPHRKPVYSELSCSALTKVAKTYQLANPVTHDK